jgi:hypothetical protein
MKVILGEKMLWRRAKPKTMWLASLRLFKCIFSRRVGLTLAAHALMFSGSVSSSIATEVNCVGREGIFSTNSAARNCQLRSDAAIGNPRIKKHAEGSATGKHNLSTIDVDDTTQGRLWFSAEYLLWSIQGNPTPIPLVTAGSWANSLPGALGQPHTQVLVGGKSLSSALRSGGRFSIGYQIDPQARLGIEASYFFLGQKTASQQAQTSGLPGGAHLAVPFFDVTGVAGRNGVPGQSVYILGGPFPGSLFGKTDALIPGFAASYRLGVASQLQGVEVNSTLALGASNGFWLEELLGIRWLQLAENLTFAGAGRAMPGGIFTPGPATDFVDKFNTQNDFFGGQFGLRASYRIGGFSAGVTGKFALGNMHELAEINGAVTTNSGTLFLRTKGTLGQVFSGGVFAQPSNLGTHQRDVFAVVPEFRFDLGYDLTSNLRLLLGYNFLWASTVARPGNQIDPNINLTRTNLAAVSRATVGTGGSPIPFPIPQGAPAPAGPIAPTFHFKDSSFWAQGLNFGVSGSF